MVTLNEKDYNRLINSIKQLRMSAIGNSNIKNLAESLKSAKIIASPQTPANLVTMNSKAMLKRLDNNQEMEVSVVYHDDADLKAKKISVFAPMGMALLGAKENEVITCNLPNGKIDYEVKKVLYQPESAGDLHL
ncbi:MAG: GreA/GreB family elongation factor [Bacteroidia bacterium]|nr:GreA/GreB family elongation factor [Bacteroidia bacterium]MCC7534523.1 GreA/GreB family elongation factor [Bacteroidia bacterium]